MFVRNHYVHLPQIKILVKDKRKMTTVKTARYETRWTIEQKEYFEYVSQLGGFKTLSDFVVFSMQKVADKIVKDHDKILATSEDKKIFFEAIINPREPNERIKKAAVRYDEIFGEK